MVRYICISVPHFDAYLQRALACRHERDKLIYISRDSHIVLHSRWEIYEA